MLEQNGDHEWESEEGNDRRVDIHGNFDGGFGDNQADGASAYNEEDQSCGSLGG